MTIDFNQETLTWIIGILQPVSSAEIHKYMQAVFEGAGRIPDAVQVQKYCMELASNGRIIRVHRKPDLFSLTKKGNSYLSRERRHSRDRARLFLLKDIRRFRLPTSREVSESGLGGDAPSVDTRHTLKEREANKSGPVVPSGHSYWPRTSQQLFQETGLPQPSRETYPIELHSFKDAYQLALAANQSVEALQLDFQTIGLMLGISPLLIQRILQKPDAHYRNFSLPKKGGGVRQIESPRTFLKVIQQFLADYYLSGLPVHDCVQSFRRDHSIITNASHHCRKAYVANIDIENYFGSVSQADVRTILQKASYSVAASEIVSGLCTKGGKLPQGAPSSPSISNAHLYGFDVEMERQCNARQLSYTRYADDITISGDDLEKIREMVGYSEKHLLEEYKLRLNRDKSRIASRNGQQRVTGVVVNEAPRPPKKLRRNIRAAIHNASKADHASAVLVEKLSGYVNYLNSFDTLKDSSELSGHRQDLVRLREKARLEH